MSAGQHQPSGRRPRRDATENAERVLAAAVRSGLNIGRQVPLSEIAADAGVGIGTLYRRYPNRAALLEALAVRAYRFLIDDADAALSESSTGLAAIEAFLETSFERRDEFVLPLHGAPFTEDSESARLRAELAGRIAAIVQRGQADGSVRADVTAWTVVRFGAMLAQPMSSVSGWDASAAEQRAIFLRGIAG